MRTAKLVLSVVVATALSGCVVADLANLVYVVADQNIGYSAGADIKPQAGKFVYSENFFTDGSGYREKCYADGVVVDYSAKIDSGTPVAQAKLDPANIYGQAVIFYKRECGIGEDATVQDVVLIGSCRQVFGDPMVMKAREKIVAYDYYASNGAHRPDWMPQVLDTIQAQAAAGDEDAKKFLSFVRIEDGEPVLANIPAKAEKAAE